MLYLDDTVKIKGGSRHYIGNTGRITKVNRPRYQVILPNPQPKCNDLVWFNEDQLLLIETFEERKTRILGNS